MRMIWRLKTMPRGQQILPLYLQIQLIPMCATVECSLLLEAWSQIPSPVHSARTSRQPHKTAYKSQITTHIPPTQSALESKSISVPMVCTELHHESVFIKYLPTTEHYDTKKKTPDNPYYVIHEIFAENKDYSFFSFKNKIPRKTV